MNSKFAKIGGIFIVLLALAALIGTTMTFAQDDAPDVPDAPPILEEPSFGPNNMEGQRGQRGSKLFTPEEREAALADALGISVETLTAAKEEARATLLQQAVADGKITETQADALLSGQNARGYLGEIFDKGAIETAVAGALGLTVEELQAARADGKRLPEIAEEQGVELSTVQEAAQAVREAALQQAVEDGLLTQEQADQLQNRQNRRGGFGGGHSGPRGNGNGGGNPQGQPPAAPSNNG